MEFGDCTNSGKSSSILWPQYRKCIGKSFSDNKNILIKLFGNIFSRSSSTIPFRSY